MGDHLMNRQRSVGIAEAAKSTSCEFCWHVYIYIYLPGFVRGKLDNKILVEFERDLLPFPPPRQRFPYARELRPGHVLSWFSANTNTCM